MNNSLFLLLFRLKIINFSKIADTFKYNILNNKKIEIELLYFVCIASGKISERVIIKKKMKSIYFCTIFFFLLFIIFSFLGYLEH